MTQDVLGRIVSPSPKDMWKLSPLELVNMTLFATGSLQMPSGKDEISKVGPKPNMTDVLRRGAESGHRHKGEVRVTQTLGEVPQ